RSVGRQFASRVGLFLRVDDFQTTYQQMVAAGVRFVSSPRDEPYGRVAVFLDLEGNRWDLLGPRIEAGGAPRDGRCWRRIARPITSRISTGRHVGWCLL